MQDVPHKYLETMESGPEAIGELLAHARGERGWEQRDVAVRLGLSLNVVQTLEASDFERLGPPVFVRGYLMRYCELVGVPEQDILERYKRLAPSEPPPLRVTRSIRPQAKMSDAGIRWFSYLLMFAVIAYLGWLGLDQVSSHFEFPGPGRSAVTGMNGDTPIALPPSTGGGSPAPGTSAGSAPPAAAASAPAEAPASAAQPPPATPQAAPALPAGNTPAPPGAAPADAAADVATATAAGAAVAPPAGAEPSADPPATDTAAAGDAQLVLAFTDDCWVDVKDARNERLAYGVLKANSIHTLSGPAPFRVTLGNAGAASIKLNGEPIDPSVYTPRQGTVSRFVVGAAPQAE